MRVNHLAIAVRDTDAALAFFRRHFPVVMMNERQLGHTGDYQWCDFHIGNFKLEIGRSQHAGADHVVITFDGKFLPYQWPTD